jgi:hypothetical protein
MSLSPHAARVTRLYRASLKNLMNWCVHRDLFIEQGNLLRAEFNANMHVKDPRLIEKIVSDGEAKLLEYQHPDPYTCARPSLDPFFSPAVDGALFPRSRAAAGITADCCRSHAVEAAMGASPYLPPLTCAPTHHPPPCCPQCRTCRVAASTCATPTTASGRPPRCAHCTPSPLYNLSELPRPLSARIARDNQPVRRRDLFRGWRLACAFAGNRAPDLLCLVACVHISSSGHSHSELLPVIRRAPLNDPYKWRCACARARRIRFARHAPVHVCSRLHGVLARGVLRLRPGGCFVGREEGVTRERVTRVSSSSLRSFGPLYGRQLQRRAKSSW